MPKRGDNICQELNCTSFPLNETYAKTGGLCAKCSKKKSVQRKPVIDLTAEPEVEPEVEDEKEPEPEPIVKKKTDTMVLCPKCGGKCYPETLEKHGSCSYCVSKKKIPQFVRQEMWLKWVGRQFDAKCWCCESNEITAFNFVAGHVLAEANGGACTADNLRPICLMCNSSMGTRHMEEVKKLLPKKEKPAPVKDENAIARFGNVGIMHDRLFAQVEQADGTGVIKLFSCVRNPQGFHAFLENHSFQ